MTSKRSNLVPLVALTATICLAYYYLQKKKADESAFKPNDKPRKNETVSGKPHASKAEINVGREAFKGEPEPASLSSIENSGSNAASTEKEVNPIQRYIQTMSSPVQGTTCPLCCEIKATEEVWVLDSCYHKLCKACLLKWTLKAEAAGHKATPECPVCQLAMTEEETNALLGRPFQPAAAAKREEEIGLDELTLQWLREHTKSCPRCGARIEKEEATCDMMECLCGYRFCYDCGSRGAECSCSPRNHPFWDNVLNRAYRSRSDPAVEASTDEQTGQVDLRSHIVSQSRKERARAEREERQCRRRRREERRTMDRKRAEEKRALRRAHRSDEKARKQEQEADTQERQKRLTDEQAGQLDLRSHIASQREKATGERRRMQKERTALFLRHAKEQHALFLKHARERHALFLKHSKERQPQRSEGQSQTWDEKARSKRDKEAGTALILFSLFLF